MSTKPKWLLPGGMGMVGRNLVKYLLDNNLASDIRIADKRMPFMAFLSPDHKAAVENPLVEVMQVDCADDEHIDRIFSESRLGGGWDYVVNLVAETAHGKPESFYEKMVDAATKLGQAAAREGVKKFVHLSTAHVYESSKKPVGEAGKVAPWTQQAEFSLRSEVALSAIRGLPLVILRPALIYGPGDVNALMPRAVCAATYIKMKAKMEFLWESELRMNTVHVFDVARAIYVAARKGEAGTTWNLADKGETDQGTVSRYLGSIFGIEVGFYGSMMSNLAKLKMDTVVEQANDTHLAPWLGMLKEAGIKNTPLSPFLHKQLLQHNHLNIDGSGIEGALGFKYLIPALTEDAYREQIMLAVTQGVFPNVFAAGGGAGGR